ncbi:hypothetical protein RM697_12845 [Ichthyenterobacterium sp. W332]|uniref:Uncharacterized protein n=1 Tax=Microcosmobacter mediterraneus TaxID=3075607 RepID=A0ABU2YPC4_9FLAO|nr:hypothetical protein [Ichthyenterobacterium sp. W332]MDT0559544.1 hypothetical protein [Ichthyenterobacterium sp. W332]
MKMRIKNKKIIFCLIMVSFGIYSIAQNDNNKELNRIITKIENQEYLFDDYELKKKSLRLANKLNKIANENELLELSKKDCKLCFSYSFWVLSKRKSDLTEQLYTDYIENSNEEQIILINEFTRKNKGCVKILISQQNFIFDIHNDGKYLEGMK